VIEALCYKPEGHVFDSRYGYGIFRVTQSFRCNMTLGSTEPLTEMSTTNLPGGKEWTAREANKLSAICELICLEIVGASTCHKTMGLHRLL
jgi:hypothetical protein